MAVVCNAAAGFADWDGRTLCVRLDDVVRFSLSAVGLISGLESVDSWTDRISETLEADILKMQSFGFDCTGIRFGVSFHSGSELEGLCRSISVDVR